MLRRDQKRGGGRPQGKKKRRGSGEFRIKRKRKEGAVGGKGSRGKVLHRASAVVKGRRTQGGDGEKNGAIRCNGFTEK